MSTEPLETLRAIAADPYTGWSERPYGAGRRAIGVLCTYAPVEVLHAAGLVPVRLMPGVTSTGLAGADRHLQSYTCAIARGVLAAATAGQWDWLAGVVFPHTCDTIQALADVWREARRGRRTGARRGRRTGARRGRRTGARRGRRTDARPASYVGTLVGPVAVESPAAEAYLVAELRRFIADLEARLGVTVTADALRASIRAYNENRRLLSDLRGRLPFSDWLSAALAGQVMPVEEHTRLLPHSPPTPSQNWEREGARGARGRVKVLLAGAVLDDPALPAFIQELGASVVDDDLCTGRRAIETQVDESCADPVVALARRELRRAPCPARYAPGQPRAERLVRLAQASQAVGVILIQQKFCEPHAFDLPALRAALDRAGLAHLTLDMEGSALDGALGTRVQAFVELLQ